MRRHDAISIDAGLAGTHPMISPTPGATLPEQKPIVDADIIFGDIIEFEHAEEGPDSPLIVVLGIGACMVVLFTVLCLVPPLALEVPQTKRGVLTSNCTFVADTETAHMLHCRGSWAGGEINGAG
jgi:hypothetical protein